MGNAAQPEMAYQWGHGSHWYMLIWSLDKIPFAQIGSQFADLDKIPYSKSEKNAKGILCGYAKREGDFDSAHFRQVTVNYDVKLGYGREDNFTHIIFCHFLNFKHPIII